MRVPVRVEAATGEHVDDDYHHVWDCIGRNWHRPYFKIDDVVQIEGSKEAAGAAGIGAGLISPISRQFTAHDQSGGGLPDDLRLEFGVLRVAREGDQELIDRNDADGFGWGFGEIQVNHPDFTCGVRSDHFPGGDLPQSGIRLGAIDEDLMNRCLVILRHVQQGSGRAVSGMAKQVQTCPADIDLYRQAAGG